MSEWSERFKLSLHERIKRNTVEFNTPNGERILMKYGGFIFKRWHVIEPPVIEENGKLKFMKANFFFGGWKNLFFLVGVLVIFGFVFWSVSNLFQQYNTIVNNTCVQSCLGNLPINRFPSLPNFSVGNLS